VGRKKGARYYCTKHYTVGFNLALSISFSTAARTGFFE
jgi:hypothetical protein